MDKDLALEADEASKPIPLEEIFDREIEDFLDQVYRLGAAGDLQTATDKIFDNIDGLLVSRSFEMCDRILRHVMVDRLPTALMRSFLTITVAAKDKLKEREGFVRRVEKAMISKRGPETTKKLLQRLV